MQSFKLLYGGLKSYVSPTTYTMSASKVDPRYGYSVWLRHMVTLARHGIHGPFPTVVELGPGNSIATGVAALLCGAQRYIGLDVLEHMATTTHESTLDELLQLFAEGADIPGSAAYPTLCPQLDDYRFPADLLAACGYRADDQERIAAIRAAVRDLDGMSDAAALLRYIVPWTSASLPAESVDLIFTQAVLQEIPHDPNAALRQTIAAMASWLRPGGMMSHQVDFGIYGLDPWNAHWTWSDLQWKLIRGRRDNFVNREPLSTYEALLQEHGLSLVAAEIVDDPGAVDAALAPRYAALPERERRARAVTLIARKGTA